MLPLLFYLGAQLGVDTLLDEPPQNDGVVERLEHRNFKICIEGRACLVAANTRAKRCFWPLSKNLNTNCRTAPACLAGMATLVCDALKEHFFARVDALRDVKDWLKQGNDRWRLCSSDSCAWSIYHRKAR
ncbi:hypothetical protein DAEQUDRAFT_727616 [Daedalea quercina L-15889]|uniref:Uncharacterized protein n=1 Tax=Daedalea quercina L-15889 TaxID=1314783 RepID=A0A165PX81_9APHY|nr:hypothetical protein DAEQUDRAFT_727616 [Daedalea quercina L-15889]